MKLPPRRPVTPQTIARIKTANAKKMADMEIEMAAASKETSEKDPESALVTSALPSGDSSLTLNNSKALLTRRTGRSSNGNKVAKWFRQVCTKEYWAEVFRPADGEVLVDQNLVSWAYLEVGVIELLGALTAYFVVLWAGKSTGSGSTPEGTPFRISPYDAWAMSKGQGIYLQTDGTSPNYTTVSGNVLDGQDQKEALAQCQSM